MSRRRGREPNLTEKLAAALLTYRHEVDGQLVPYISYDRAKTMTAKRIIAEFECDHHPFGAWLTDGVPINEPWNLTWRPKPEHRRKTNKVDIPAAAKSKRIAKKKHRKPKPKSKYRRKMNGTVELRT